MPNQLKTAIEKKKYETAKREGDVGILIAEKVEEITSKYFDSIKTELSNAIDSALEEIRAQIESKEPPEPVIVKEYPTEEELTAIIESLMPEVENGETPTQSQLLDLIKPLIPKIKIPKDGETPSDEKLLKLIKPLIPKPAKIEKKLVPDTGSQIAKKLNETEESVNMAVIRGLDKKLKQITLSVREKKGGGSGGGGMGNWLHERKGVSSATTSISTNSKVAAGGTAALIRYQGQVLALNVQYSIGADSKTFNLLFTPQDNKVIDITYVRS